MMFVQVKTPEAFIPDFSAACEKLAAASPGCPADKSTGYNGYRSGCVFVYVSFDESCERTWSVQVFDFIERRTVWRAEYKSEAAPDPEAVWADYKNQVLSGESNVISQ